MAHKKGKLKGAAKAAFLARMAKGRKAAGGGKKKSKRRGKNPPHPGGVHPTGTQTKKQRKASLGNLAKADRATGHPAAAKKVAKKAAAIHTAPAKPKKRKASKKKTAHDAPKKRKARKSKPRSTQTVAAIGKHGTMKPRKGKNKNKVPAGKVTKVKTETTLRTKGGKKWKITDVFRTPNAPHKMAWGPMIMFVGGLSLATGAACIIHAHYVTMAPKGAAHAAMGKDAALRIAAKPTMGVYVAETGVAVLTGIAAGALRNKYPKIAAAMGGISLACLLYEGSLFVKHEIIPRIAKVADGDEISYQNRWYPQVQMNVADLQRKAIDAQDADPNYIGWSQTADGRLDPSYKYGQVNGNPLDMPTNTDGTPLLVQPNVSSGILEFFDPIGDLGIGKKIPKATGSNVAGRTPKRHSALLLGQQRPAAAAAPKTEPNAAGSCCGGCAVGGPCAEKEAKALLEEAAALDALHAQNTGAGYDAAAKGLRNQAAGLQAQAKDHAHDHGPSAAAGIPEDSELRIDLTAMDTIPPHLFAHRDGKAVRFVQENAAAGAPQAPAAPRPAPKAAAPVPTQRRTAPVGAPVRPWSQQYQAKNATRPHLRGLN